MDPRNQHNSSGGSFNPSHNVQNHGVSSAQAAVAPAYRTNAAGSTSSTGGVVNHHHHHNHHQQHHHNTPGPLPPPPSNNNNNNNNIASSGVPMNQLSRSGGITLAIRPNNAGPNAEHLASLQKHMLQAKSAGTMGMPPPPQQQQQQQSSTATNIQPRPHAVQHQVVAPKPSPQNINNRTMNPHSTTATTNIWNVPNPLSAAPPPAPPTQQITQQPMPQQPMLQQPMQQQQQQQRSLAHHMQQNNTQQQQQSRQQQLMPQPMQQRPSATIQQSSQPRMQQVTTHQPQPIQQPQLPSPIVRVHQSVGTGSNGMPIKKPKVTLSQEAKQALAKAIWSAIRSPEGVIAPDLMEAALATGLPRHAILNAVRVAREREAAKRKALQQQQLQQQQQQNQQQNQFHNQQQQQHLHSQQHHQQQNQPHVQQQQQHLVQQHQHHHHAQQQNQHRAQQQQNQHLVQQQHQHRAQQQGQNHVPQQHLVQHRAQQQQHHLVQHQQQRHHIQQPVQQQPNLVQHQQQQHHVQQLQQQQQNHRHHHVQQQLPAPQPRQQQQQQLHHYNHQSQQPTPPPQQQQHVPVPKPAQQQYPTHSIQRPSHVASVAKPAQTQPSQSQRVPPATPPVAPKSAPVPQKQLSATPKAPASSSKAPTNVVKTSTSTSKAAPAAAAITSKGTTIAPKPTPSSRQKSSSSNSNSQQSNAAKALLLKTEERAKWNRVHSGVFMLQKGKFMTLPNSITAMIRSPSVLPALAQSGRKRPRSEILRDAVSIQTKLLCTATSETAATEALLDPEKFKRVKMEPKKHGKAIDRAIKKGRQAAAEFLNKQHKELSKSIASHQQEFFKFHRLRRSEATRIAKTIRDSMEKADKKKEKDAVQAERARLAALKANDMDAYSKLLEETKNERLQFLMERTEKHFSQISNSLIETRTGQGIEAPAAVPSGTGSYYASAHLKTEEVRQPSILVGGDLKEYQLSGLQWLVSLYNNKLNGILADEMGLGKTIQAISLVSYLMEFKQNLGPFLVIVPLSTLSNWTNEFNKWCPSAHVISYKGTPAQRKEMYKTSVRLGHFNVLLTTYEYIIKDKSSLRKISWQYAIVDEGHRMKNSQSKFAKTLASQYTTAYRLLLTGTPLMNDLSELWSLLNFLLPTIFNSVDTFDQWFNRPFSQFGNSNASAEDEADYLSNEERMLIIHRLHELLRPFMLRRVKSEVLDQLPEKVEKVLRCELSSWQKELYKQISAKAVEENASLGSDFVQPQPSASRGLNNVVMQLRKVCNHPYLFSPEGYHIDDTIIRSSGKLELLDRMLPKLKAAGHRVLMFTQMTAAMTILEDYFTYRGYLSLRLDGSTPAEEREKRMYKFNSPDSPYFIFLLSTRAGGLGLNLTAADTVIIFDSDWNPMMDLQAQDRAHRIGQRSDVSVFRLITYSPVEEKILSRATEKLNMSELVVEAGKFDKRSVENDNSLERKKLMEVLLTDFDTTAASGPDKSTTDGGSDDEDDDGSETSDKENLNELLSNNEIDFQLYEEIDRQCENDAFENTVSLFTSPDDIPDWIKYPRGKKAAAETSIEAPTDGSRKRKEVLYDDGLTEKQFLRLMEKQFDGEEAERDAAKASRRAAKASARGGGGGGGVDDDDDRDDSTKVAAVASSTAAAASSSTLTDWTFRKLISCSKSVVALKDPSTKRRLSEIFLEKPSPEQYPDYYELIEKPIAINDILRKCRAKVYADLQEFRDDWKLMFANAITFNGEGSWVVEDSKALERELDRVLKKNGFHEDSKPIPPKKKKLRIKLSLKTLKTKEDIESGGDNDDDEEGDADSFRPDHEAADVIEEEVVVKEVAPVKPRRGRPPKKNKNQKK